MYRFNSLRAKLSNPGKIRLEYLGLLAILLTSGCAMKPIDEMSAEDVFSDTQVAALSRAAETGDVKKIEVLVKQGVDVNSRGRENVTPLLRSIKAKNHDGYLALLNHKADPNVLDDHGHAVIFLAANAENPEWLREALAHGGDSNLVNKGNHFAANSTPIFYAIGLSRAPNAKLLIDAGADVNHRNGDQATPLTKALVDGKLEIACMLIEAGADIHAKGQFGKDAVALANDRRAELESPLEKKIPSPPEWKESVRKLIESLNAKGANLKPYDD